MGIHPVYEPMIQGLIDHEFGISDHFITESVRKQLLSNLKEYFHGGMMKEAGIGKDSDHVLTKTIRGDLVKWLEPNGSDTAERAFFDAVDSFIAYLNATCFTSINAYEFHYAVYEPGAFYKRHLDRFRSDSGRKFTLVTYLNEDWTEEDGGELTLYFQDHEKMLQPKGCRSVFFRSNEIEHEVAAAGRHRYSITGWLKSV